MTTTTSETGRERDRWLFSTALLLLVGAVLSSGTKDPNIAWIPGLAGGALYVYRRILRRKSAVEIGVEIILTVLLTIISLITGGRQIVPTFLLMLPIVACLR